MEVRINKAELLDVVKKNYAKHKEIVEEAFAKYREAAIAEMDSMLADAKAGKRVRRGFSLVEPIDQSREYEKAIRQIEMSVDDQIKLEDHEFSCYVMDQWSWKQQFTISNSMYSEKARE